MNLFACGPFGYSHVLPALALGGRPPEGHRFEGKFDALVLTAYSFQTPKLPFPDVRVYRIPLRDATPTDQEIRWAVRMGRDVARHVRKNGRVLVTCEQGRNRSGLVTGIALVYLGMEGQQAIDHIRKNRPYDALSNRDFRGIIRAVAQDRTRWSREASSISA